MKTICSKQIIAPESVGKGQNFGMGSVLVAVCSLQFDQACLNGIWLHEGKHSVWRAKVSECNLLYFLFCIIYLQASVYGDKPKCRPCISRCQSDCAQPAHKEGPDICYLLWAYLLATLEALKQMIVDGFQEFAFSQHCFTTFLSWDKHWISWIVGKTKCVASQSTSDTIGEHHLFM